MAVLNTALYPIAAASLAIDPDFGVVHDFSDDGVMHSRQLFGAEYFIIDARWDLLDAAKRAALETFLITYRLELITFDLDGHTYTTRMTSGPSRRYVSGHLYALSATFRGTRVVTT